MKSAVFCDVTPCGSCKTDVSEERSACIIRVTRIGDRVICPKFLTSVLQGDEWSPSCSGCFIPDDGAIIKFWIES
jgi:hypothetical protein